MKYLWLLLVILLFTGARQYTLKLTCPIDGYEFYYINVDEITYGMHEELYFLDMKELTPISLFGKDIHCPNDGASPIITQSCRENENGCSMVHTNKGWMPKK